MLKISLCYNFNSVLNVKLTKALYKTTITITTTIIIKILIIIIIIIIKGRVGEKENTYISYS